MIGLGDVYEEAERMDRVDDVAWLHASMYRLGKPCPIENCPHCAALESRVEVRATEPPAPGGGSEEGGNE